LTILFAALRPNHDFAGSSASREELKRRCEREARALALQSMFENPASIETVQAMILLAVYSEKTWFALGHALQMAGDLRLNEAVDQLLKEENPCHESQSQEQKAHWYELTRRARTWMLLHHAEREISYGTARPPRIPEVSQDQLRRSVAILGLFASDMRFVSIIEGVQLRGRDFSSNYSIGFAQFSDEASALGYLRSTVPLTEKTVEENIEFIDNNFDEWFRYWDAQFECKFGFSACSQCSSIKEISSSTRSWM
jgi:hypothetical protein